jgi:hypothetical protein
MRKNFVALATLLVLALSGCGAVQIANNSIQVERALSNGKAVLISKAQTFNPETDVSESIELDGAYRPPLTYWINRETKKPFVLGARDSDEGKGGVLTDQHYYYVLDPGIYDFAGYVKKQRLGNLNNLARTDKNIKSNIGFVNFSETTLPNFYTYQAWVPSTYSGSTFDGNTITNWYSPGYYATRGARNTTKGVFVDMRGLVPNAANGKPNIASFFVLPGQVVVVPDFKMDFTHGECNAPSEGQLVCPLTSLELSAAFTAQHEATRETMKRFFYSESLIKKVESSFLVPGEFFRTQKMEVDTRSRTTQGQPYGKFRVTQLTMPAPSK